MEPEQPHQLKCEWKRPEMVKPNVKARSEGETETNKKTRSNMFSSQSLVVAVV